MRRRDREKERCILSTHSHFDGNFDVIIGVNIMTEFLIILLLWYITKEFLQYFVFILTVMQFKYVCSKALCTSVRCNIFVSIYRLNCNCIGALFSLISASRNVANDDDVDDADDD